MFDFDLKDELQVKIRKLYQKDKKKVEILNKKMKEIVNCNHQSIQRYKNLRYNLKSYKRVHIDKNFVLTFKVNLEQDFILFVHLDHHDNIY